MRLAAAYRSVFLAPLFVAALAISSWSSAAFGGSSALMLYFGGFGSCMVSGSLSELKAGPQIDAFVEALKAGGYSHVTVLRSCFAIGNERLFSRFDGEWGYESSPEEFLAELPAVAQNAGGDVFIMGQSHGGTMAMRATVALKNYDIKALVTFDPISIANCGAGGVTGGFFAGQPSQGCSEDPADLRPLHPKIASVTDRWINFFQTQYYLLHSAQIDAADENWETSYGDPNDTTINAHSRITADEELWSYLRDELAAH